ncbi:MAG TPA: hypothetical protein VKI01_03765 [Acidimicrobiia bacterium]|nr:hypothetical protein [Acidimicrobiia bacterium]
MARSLSSATLGSKSRGADTAQTGHFAGEMRLIGIAAEDRGDAEGRGAVDEPPEAENTLVLLRSQSAVPEEETAKVSA